MYILEELERESGCARGYYTATYRNDTGVTISFTTKNKDALRFKMEYADILKIKTDEQCAKN